MPETTVLFSTDLFDPSSYPDLGSVGTVYEVAINSVGYMLYDGHEGENFERRRAIVPLDPPRLATSETPFSEAIERYTFVGFSDFRLGAGQFRLDRPDSDGARYHDSDGVNPFEDGLTLLPSTSQQISTSYAAARSVAAGGNLYVQDGAKAFKYTTTPGGGSTSFSIAAAGTVVSLTSDGRYWYAADGADIYRGTTADPTSAWSAVDAQLVEWAGQRVCAAYPSSGSTPNVFTTLNDSGLEEVAGGRLVLPVGFTINSITGGQGFVWFSAYAGSEAGVVYAWRVGSDAPTVALQLPNGQVPRSVFFYQDQVMVRAESTVGSGDTKALIYRCVVGSDGALTPFLVAEINGTSTDDGPGAFGASGRFVFFSWSDMDGDGADGIGCIDLSTGGYCRWLKGPVGSSATVRSIVFWKNRTVFTVDGQGAYIESLTAFVEEGWLETSISDLASGVEKVFDTVRLWAKPLVADSSIEIDYTIDEGASYVNLATGTISSAGQRAVSAVLAKKASSIGLRVTLAGPGTSTPTVIAFQAQLHPVGKSDVVLQLPIDCGDTVSDLRGRDLDENGHGAGANRVRVLEELAQTRVKVQDIDWKVTGVSEVFEVVQVESTSRNLRNPRSGTALPRSVTVLTLRAIDK